MPNIYVANKGGHDYSPAEIYLEPGGKFIFVSEGTQNRFSIANMARVWGGILLNSSKEDMILITSLTILNCVGCALFAAKHKQINFLLYRNERYLKRTLMVEQILEAEGGEI